MKRLWSILSVVLLFSLVMVTTGCAAKGTSKEGYDELKYQLTVAQAQLSDTRDELEARLSDIQEELEAQRPPVDEEPAGSQKLVGYGSYAEWEDDEIHKRVNTSLILTNPDCVSSITIERISVFAYNGSLVYEGPLLKWREETPWDVPMEPHETRMSELDQYLSGFEWPSESEVWMNFTVEVFWTKSLKDGLPLTGWVGEGIVRRDSEGQLIEIELAGAIPMVNMNQVLIPVKEEKPK